MPYTRERLIARHASELERQQWPRLHMFLLVALTGLVGLLSSFAMLNAGLTTMWLRYPLALCAAYACFLLSLWWWTRHRFRDWFDADLSNFSDVVPDTSANSSGSGSEPAFESGGEGSFSGGGASGSFDAADNPAADAETANGSSDWTDSLGDSADIDIGEAGIPLLILALVAGAALSSLWVVYAAPTLMAELLIDGVLATTLYRSLYKLERREWFGTAVRKTIWPFVATGVFLALLGWGIAKQVSGADSIGDLWHPPAVQAEQS